MKITVITLFPNMVTPFFAESIVKRAQEKNAVELSVINLRDFALDDYGTVDDRPYGGGTGMVLRVEPIQKALLSIKGISENKEKKKVVITSPQGTLFTQKKAKEYAQLDELVIISGHYEAVDERVMQYVDEEISMGDFIMTGGEIAASAIVDATIRLLPGVLKKENATTVESFFTLSINELSEVVVDPQLETLKKQNIKEIMLLEYPQYTRPAEYEGKAVPEALLSGDPKKMRRWQIQMAWENTKKKRPDLLLR